MSCRYPNGPIVCMQLGDDSDVPILKNNYYKLMHDEFRSLGSTTLINTCVSLSLSLSLSLSFALSLSLSFSLSLSLSLSLHYSCVVLGAHNLTI